MVWVSLDLPAEKRNLVKHLAAATVLIAATATLPAVISPAVAADSGLRVVHAGPNVESGGYPTISWGTNGVVVHFEDATPQWRDEYAVSVTPVGGEEPVATTTYDTYKGWDGTNAMTWVGQAGTYALDTDYVVSIEQRQGDVVVDSVTKEFRYEAVGHPTKAVLKHKRVGGKRTVKAGSVVRINWTGKWEAGTKLTQVVAAKTRKGISERDYLRCEGSWCPSKKAGQPKFVKPGTEPVKRFRVPKRFAGKKLIIVTYGRVTNKHGDRKAVWGWEWTLRVKR